MPQFSDDLFLGSAVIGNRGPGPNSSGNPSESGSGVGPLGRVYVWDAVPLAASANNIVVASTTLAAGLLPLTAGAGTTSFLSNDNVTMSIRLDMMRAVTLQSVGVSTAVQFTISGFDDYGQAVTCSLAGPNANTIATLKCFRVITSIMTSAAVTSINIGTSDILGLPWALTNMGYALTRSWNSLADATASVTLADGTNPATQMTSDPRGKYALPNASDGIKRLIMVYALTGMQAGPNATRVGAIGVTSV